MAFGYIGQGIVGDVGFDSVYADLFWRQGGLGAPYNPPLSSVLDAANQQWLKLQDLIDMQAPSAARAQQRLQKLRDDLRYYVSTIEGWVAQRYDFQRESADYFVRNNVVRVYNGINAALATFANESWPDATEELAAAEQRRAEETEAAAKRQAEAEAAAAEREAEIATQKAKTTQTQAAIAEAKKAIIVAETKAKVAREAAVVHKEAKQQSGGFTASLTSPAVLAVGALLLVGVGVVVYKSRRSSVSGYRRSRRRRR